MDELHSHALNGPLSVLDGKYQLVRQLGEGGMGVVYEARHTGTGRRCAVKVIAADAQAKSPDIVGRFRREAMASGAIESQYIAQVMDTGVDPQSGSPYIVMELLLGEDVDQAVKRLGPLPPDVALRTIAQACLGLQKAHDADVIHRDIKPANIFLARRDGSEILAKILDFGIAKVKADPLSSPEGTSLTQSGSMLGSPLYMSPEQALGQKTIDHRTDIWSLGVVLYEALTGTTPHPSEDTLGVLIMRICSQPSPPIQDRAPWVTPEIAAVVHRALALDPAARWASASEMHAAIRALLPGGHALDESMFVELSAETKQVTARRFSLPGDDAATAHTSPHAATSRALRTMTVETSGTLAGGVLSGQPRSRPIVPIALMATLGAAIIAVGAWRLSSHTEVTVPATGLVQSETAMPPGPASAALPQDQIRRLVVLPLNVHAEVDGKEVATTDGAVTIAGPLGSTHHVRISSDGREKVADVVIGSEGVVPALVDLGPAPATAPSPPKRVAVAAPPSIEPVGPKKNPLRMDVK